uniref:Uncharacterized protein n=1 Tax=Sinocyclocheilus anshuiensis TaxID=1608454 RepID=A0A671MBD9_9TELE
QCFLVDGVAQLHLTVQWMFLIERPEIPPTHAQATARRISPESYSYTASILRLLRNKAFILLVITYGECVTLRTTDPFRTSNCGEDELNRSKVTLKTFLMLQKLFCLF